MLREPPFHALLPFQVLHYPIPQLMKEQPAVVWQRWLQNMDPGVLRWKEQTRELSNSGNQIYIHVPFCPFFCHFCPLYKTTDPAHRNDETKERYVASLLEEIEQYARKEVVKGNRFRTLYFGGGTPTQLTPAQLGRIVDRVRSCFWLDDNVEITLEGVATQMLAPGYLEECLSHGFNRVSFGVQSLDPLVRQKIGRGEKVEDYDKLVSLVGNLGTALPFNVDLMAGLPGQALESHERDLATVLDWGVGSLDIYAYWMVPGTRLFDKVSAGQRQAPRYGEALLEMRRRGSERLVGQGFRQISGEAYVRTDPDVFMQTTFGGGGNALNTALGLGPSAIGFVNGTLYQNVADLDAYCDSIRNGSPPVRVADRINVAQARRRAIMFGLQRLHVPRALLRRREEKIFQRWAEQGLVERSEGAFRCTPEGALWYNQMQLTLLTLSEQRRLMGLLGTPRQQAQALAKSGAHPTHQTDQLLDLIRDGGGLGGRLRVWGYRNLVRVKTLPMFDERAVGFSGPIGPKRHILSRLKRKVGSCE